LIKRFTGKTPSRHLLEFRVEEACRLLERGGTLAIAAAKAGFSDQPHMTRSFQRVLSMTPAQFVKRARTIVQD
jgi:hypothetical protein